MSNNFHPSPHSHCTQPQAWSYCCLEHHFIGCYRKVTLAANSTHFSSKLGWMLLTELPAVKKALAASAAMQCSRLWELLPTIRPGHNWSCSELSWVCVSNTDVCHQSPLWNNTHWTHLKENELCSTGSQGLLPKPGFFWKRLQVALQDTTLEDERVMVC